MAGGVNKVILVGNLGADPDMRYTPSGQGVCELRIATSESWNDKNGQKQERTEWHRVVCWNNKGNALADVVERYCKKGDKIYIEGSIEYRSWQDREGQTRYTTEVIARDLILLSSRSADADDSFPASKVAASAAPRKEESFGDFPEALDAQDDDLPF